MVRDAWRNRTTKPLSEPGSVRPVERFVTTGKFICWVFLWIWEMCMYSSCVGLLRTHGVVKVTQWGC